MSRQIPIDVCFVLDATNSTGPVLDALKQRVVDITCEMQFSRQQGVYLSRKYAVVAYRDPVDCPPPGSAARREIMPEHPFDVHEFQDFQGAESLEEYIGTIQSYGGGDQAEDWAGALDMALHQLSWRNGKKCIFWIADANAHGKRFSLESEKDTHDAEGPRLEALAREMAGLDIYFIGINIKKGTDPGCARTLSELRTIVGAAGGKPFTIEDFTIPIDPEVGFVIPDQEFSPDCLDDFVGTVRGQMDRVLGQMVNDGDAE